MAKRRTPPIVFAGQLGFISFVLLVTGPLLVHAGIATPTAGLIVSSFSGISSALGAGMIAFSMTKGIGPRGAANWIGCGLAVICTVLTTAWAAAANRYVEAHDVATNADSFPVFEGEEPGHPIRYEGLAGVPFDLPPSEAFERARRAATKMPWRITSLDNAHHHLEAIAVSTIFRFEDRIAIDVRTTTASTAVVEVRAKSEQTTRDLGRNLDHVLDYLRILKAER